MSLLRDFVNRWIIKILSRYLVLEDEEQISSGLYSHDKETSVTLQNVQIKPLKIPWKRHKPQKKVPMQNGSGPMDSRQSSQRTESYITYLNLYGSISKLKISLSWTSFMNLKQSKLEIDGLHIAADLTVERDDSPPSPRRMPSSSLQSTSASSMGTEEQNLSDNGDDNDSEKTSSFWGYIKHERERIMESLRGIIPSSELVRRAVFHVINTLCLRLSDVELRLFSTRDDSNEISHGYGMPTVNLVASLKRLNFVPLLQAGTGNKTSTVNGSLNTTQADWIGSQRLVHLDFDSLTLDFVDEFGDLEEKKTANASDTGSTFRRQDGQRHLYQTLPVLEPVSFSGTIRRSYGLTFFDLLHGYEVTGRLSRAVQTDEKDPENCDSSTDPSDTSTSDQAIPDEPSEADADNSDNPSNSLVLHLGDTRLRVLLHIRDLLFGNALSNDDQDKNTIEQEREREATAKRRRKTTRMLSKILLFLLTLVIVVLCWMIFITASSVIVSLHEFVQTNYLSVESVLYHASIVVGTVYILSHSKSITTLLHSTADVAFVHGMDIDAARRNPALIRFLLDQLVIILPNKSCLALSEVSISGRLNISLLNVWAARLSLKASTQDKPSSMPAAKATDVRAAKNQDGWSILFGTFDELKLPGKFTITESLAGTVVHYGNEKLDIKLDRVVGIRHDNDQDEDVSSGPKRRKSLKVDVDDDSRIVDKAAVRSRINEDIAAELHKFHTIALMFEGIPLSTAHKNLWRYTNTFTGAGAVDYMLELNIARSREEAVLIALQMQSDFSLFEDIRGDVHEFRDDPDCIYRFVKPERRRNWESRRTFRPIRGTTGSSSDDDGAVAKFIPFLLTVRMNEFVLSDIDGNSKAMMRSVYAVAKPSSFISALQVNLSVQSISTELLVISRGRLQGYYHPDLPSEIHDGQFTVEYMKATGGFTAESWYKTLGLRDSTAVERTTKKVVKSTTETTKKVAGITKEAIDQTVEVLDQTSDAIDSALENSSRCTVSQSNSSLKSKTPVNLRSAVRPVKRESEISFSARPRPLSNSQRAASADSRSTNAQRSQEVPKGVFRLPYFYISPFTIRLKLKGLMASSKENRIRVGTYEGDESTTSNDLIVYFVTVVLGRSPGMIGNMNIMGVNVAEGGGLTAGIFVGAAMIPGGQYIGLAAIAVMDGVNGAIAAGKRQRGRPDDVTRPGDFFRGIVYGAVELNRKGAMRRGKTDAEYYDSDGRVRVDVGDFAAGATIETGQYVKERKAKFIGATVATATVITLTVFTGPLLAIVAALVVGAGTEIAVNKIDEAVAKRTKDEKKDGDDDNVDDSSILS